jgi:hypothetical protein
LRFAFSAAASDTSTHARIDPREVDNAAFAQPVIEIGDEESSKVLLTEWSTSLEDGARGGGSVFVAFCAFDDVELGWMSGPTLRITLPGL